MSETISRRTMLAAVAALATTSSGREPCDVVTIDGSGEHECPRRVRFVVAGVTSGPRRFCKRHVGCATLPLVRVG
jgi:hypothetical protein